MKKSLLFLGIIAVITAVAGIAIFAFNPPVDDTDGTRPVVYTSIHPVHLVVEQIGGEEVVVKNAIPSGNEAHNFIIPAQTRAEIEESDGLVYLGLEFDPWAEKIAEENPDLPRLEFAHDATDLLSGQHEDHEGEEHHDEEEYDETEKTTEEKDETHSNNSEHSHDEDEEHMHEEGEEHSHDDEGKDKKEEDEDHDHEDGHDHGEFDPHIWFDTTIMTAQAAQVRDFLIDIEPDKAGTFSANYDAFVTDLEEIDQQYTTQLAQCNNDTLYTSHDAFSYLGRSYGFELKSVYGLSTFDQPSIAKTADFIQQIKQDNISYIAREDIISQTTLSQIQAETDVQFLLIQPMESVNADMEDLSYRELMEQNLETITTALGCGQ